MNYEVHSGDNKSEWVPNVETDHWWCLSAGGDCWLGSAHRGWPSECEQSQCVSHTPSRNPGPWSLHKDKMYHSMKTGV